MMSMGWPNLFVIDAVEAQKKYRQGDNYARRNGQNCVQPHLGNVAPSRADF
jgi:hypothetical protein